MLEQTHSSSNGFEIVIMWFLSAISVAFAWLIEDNHLHLISQALSCITAITTISYTAHRYFRNKRKQR